MVAGGAGASSRVTPLLRAWSDGNDAALEQLLPLVEAELRRLARAYMARERRGHTLQTTALVNEAFRKAGRRQRPAPAGSRALPGYFRAVDAARAHVRYVFGSLRFMATHAPGLMKSVMKVTMLRELALAVPLSVGSRRMPREAAARAVDDLAGAVAFEETFESIRTPFSGEIAVPVTVTFGDRDWIFPKWSRRRQTLPPHTRWVEHRGWGHVPMWVDPAGVSRLILEST